MISRFLHRARSRLVWLTDGALSALSTRRRSRGQPDEFASGLVRGRDSSGSGFFSQPGFAVLCGEGGSDPSGYDGDSGDAMARVASALGDELRNDNQLGRPFVRDASYGRGAAGWTAVVEWTLEAAAQGVVGLIATAPIVAAARRYVALKRHMAQRGATVLINRAGAALVAAEDVARDAPSDSKLWLESAEEMSAAAGRPLTELSYVGADPWLVFVVDLDRNLRYVRIVSPSGDIVGRTTTSPNELERLYLPAPD